MNRDEKLIAWATVGLIVTAIGAFLPWSRIGGRTRSGFATADTFIDLAEGILPDAVAWVGRWWYLPTILALGAWAMIFVRGTRLTKIVPSALVAIGLAVWWIFVWAGDNWNVINIRLAGPIMSTVGLIVVAGATTRDRIGLLHPTHLATEPTGTADP